MDYATFFAQFGGSARTKNIGRPARGFLNFSRTDVADRPVISLPPASGLPSEFIRLCPWEMEFLWCIVRRSRRGIVEIGRYKGGSTFLMACANAYVPIYSIDVRPQNDDSLVTAFRDHNVGQNVRLIVGDSQATEYEFIDTFDVLFIDGDHTYEGCFNDIVNWYDSLAPNGYIVCHDSYLGTHGVQDAVADFIEQNPNIQVILSPFIGPSYWRYPTGSMACLMKRGPWTQHIGHS